MQLQKMDKSAKDVKNESKHEEAQTDQKAL